MAYCFIWWKKYFNNKNKDRVRGFLLQMKICSALQINTDYVIQKKIWNNYSFENTYFFYSCLCYVNRTHTQTKALGKCYNKLGWHTAQLTLGLNLATENHHRSCKISCSLKKPQFLQPFNCKSKGSNKKLHFQATVLAEKISGGGGGFPKAPPSPATQRTTNFFFHMILKCSIFFAKEIITECFALWVCLEWLQIIQLVTKNPFCPFTTTHTLNFTHANQSNENTITN